MRRRELVLVSCRRRVLLPVREVTWLAEVRTGRVTDAGYHRGRKPGNHGLTYPPTPPTPREALAIINACPTTIFGKRDRALLVFLWRCGTRISEALDLRPAQIDLEEGTVTILHGKGNKRRVLGVDPQTRDELATWLLERDRLGCLPHQPVFCALKSGHVGNRVWPSAVREALKVYADLAGVRKRVTPHNWRHACACDLAREGAPLHIVQRQLGHADLGMTARYLAGISGAEVVRHMATRAWPDPEPSLVGEASDRTEPKTEDR